MSTNLGRGYPSIGSKRGEEMTQSSEKYWADGYVVLEQPLQESLVAELGTAAEREVRLSGERVIREDSGESVRAVYGSHRFETVVQDICREPYILDFVTEIIGEPVYVYQTKINSKFADSGDGWPWHTDIVYWSEMDGVPRDDLVNVVVFLDDVREDSGPIEFFVGSHARRGFGLSDDSNAKDHDDWQRDQTTDLRFKFNSSDLASLLNEFSDPKPALGPSGTVLVFHPSIIHGSRQNTGGNPRRILIVTFNAVTNRPAANKKRPWFLCEDNFAPVTSGRHSEPLA